MPDLQNYKLENLVSTRPLRADEQQALRFTFRPLGFLGLVFPNNHKQVAADLQLRMKCNQKHYPDDDNF